MQPFFRAESRQRLLRHFNSLGKVEILLKKVHFLQELILPGNITTEQSTSSHSSSGENTSEQSFVSQHFSSWWFTVAGAWPYNMKLRETATFKSSRKSAYSWLTSKMLIRRSNHTGESYPAESIKPAHPTSSWVCNKAEQTQVVVLYLRATIVLVAPDYSGEYFHCFLIFK